jgi:hypothetical protein
MAKGRGAKKGGTIASVAGQLDRSTGHSLKQEIDSILDKRPEITSAIADMAKYLHDNPHQCGRLLQWMHVGLSSNVGEKLQSFPRSYSQIRFLSKTQLIKDLQFFVPELSTKCMEEIQKNNPADTLLRLYGFATKCGPKDKLFSKQIAEFMMTAGIRYEVFGRRLDTLPALLQANSGTIPWGQTMGYFKLVFFPGDGDEPSSELSEGLKWTHVVHIRDAMAIQMT